MEVSKTEDAWLIERFGEAITATGQCPTHGGWSKPSRSKTPYVIQTRCPQCDADAESARKQATEEGYEGVDLGGGHEDRKSVV